MPKKMEMPAKCSKCGKLYDVGKEFSKKDKDKNFLKLVKKRYGSVKFLCSKCA